MAYLLVVMKREVKFGVSMIAPFNKSLLSAMIQGVAPKFRLAKRQSL